mgnify:CR=1 FL=1
MAGFIPAFAARAITKAVIIAPIMNSIKKNASSDICFFANQFGNFIYNYFIKDFPMNSPSRNAKNSNMRVDFVIDISKIGDCGSRGSGGGIIM